MAQGANVLQLFLSFLNLQKDFIEWAWATHDPFWMAAAKRSLVLVPVCAVVLGLWASLPSLLSLGLRPNRRAFFNQWLLTWWDLAQAVGSYWGGVFRFFIVFPAALLTVARTALVFLWLLVQDVALVPYRLVRHFVRPAPSPATYTEAFARQALQDHNLLLASGQAVLSAFLVPPLQLLAATLNFWSLLAGSGRLFEVPFNGLDHAFSVQASGAASAEVDDRQLEMLK